MNKFSILLFSLFFLSINTESNLLAKENESGVCPQERKTKKAPRLFQKYKNPLPNSSQHINEGKLLYEKTARPLQCVLCHGVKGNGIGDPDFESTPAARNFTCAPTMAQVSDGQLYWIVKNGSTGTSMPQFTNLDDTSIWKLVLYIRSFSKTNEGTQMEPGGSFSLKPSVGQLKTEHLSSLYKIIAESYLLSPRSYITSNHNSL